VLTRRNAIIIFASIELMMNAVNLAFVALRSSLGGRRAARFSSFFVIAVAPAEVAVGLAHYRGAVPAIKETVNIDRLNILKW